MELPTKLVNGTRDKSMRHRIALHERMSHSPAAGTLVSGSKIAVLLHVVAFIAVFLCASSLLGQSAGSNDSSVTAVHGESWILHLNRSFSHTSMGKTWDLGPAPPGPGEESTWKLELSPDYATQTMTMHGADLYRISCRGCHGPVGQGAPPEINAVTGPVEATSVEATMERMKQAGRDMDPADARAMAKESKESLIKRLHVGGTNMPAPTLTEPEIHSLVAYLDELSDVPGAQKNQIAIKQTPVRVGEHIVKSTCHVCHSATGPDPTPQQILQGAIPPLSTFTTRVSLPQFVQKVTYGAPIVMGKPPTTYRGRMPVFTYLTEDEAADAYTYLMLYPPKP
jgi:mono/diheme cytochrome c family protein